MSTSGPTVDQTFDVLGFCGGSLLAVALMPQIILAHKRQSCLDISYVWQAVYITGLSTLIIYYLHYGLYAIFYPIAIEWSCIVYLTCYKVYLEIIVPKFSANREPMAARQEGSPLVINDVAVAKATALEKSGEYGAL